MDERGGFEGTEMDIGAGGSDIIEESVWEQRSEAFEGHR